MPTPHQINEGVKLTLRELANAFNGDYSEDGDIPFAQFHLSAEKLDALEVVLGRYETIQYDRAKLNNGYGRIDAYGSGK